ncbi:MAG: TraG family conjugative transposon ATPase [Flavobacteriales bacterium]
MSKQPIFKIEDHILFNSNGQITFCYKIKLPEIFQLNKNDLSEINSVWKSIIHTLPEKSILHRQDFYFEKSYAPPFSENSKRMDRQYQFHHIEKPYLEEYNYLFYSKKTKPQKGSKVSDEFKGLDNTFYHTVKLSNQYLNDNPHFKVEPLTEEELRNLLNRYSFFEDSNDVKDGYLNINGKMNYINVNENYAYHYLIEQKDLPEKIGSTHHETSYETEKSEIPLSFLYPIGLGFKESHILNNIIFIPEREDFLSSLKVKRNMMASLSHFDSNNKVNKDLYSTYIEQATSFNKPVIQSIVLQPFTKNYQEMEDLQTQTRSAVKKCYGMDATFLNNDLETLYYGCFAGNTSTFNFERDGFISTPTLSSVLFNNNARYQNSKSDFGIRLNDRISGIPLHVDISDEPKDKGLTYNRNKLVFGPSGSGKSFFTNHLIRDYLKFDTHVVIIDIGDSYKRTCMYEKGHYLTYDDEHPIKFNPFFIKNLKKQDIPNLLDKMQSIITLILTLWKRDADHYSKEEYSMLYASLELYYHHIIDHSIPANFDSYFSYMMNEFKALSTENKELDYFDFKSFEICLKPFKTGNQFGYLLNDMSEKSLIDEPFIVFELEKIKDNKTLFPIVSLIIMDTFIQKMLTLSGKRKVILIEEAWKAMSSDVMAHFMKYLFKTARKYFGEVALVTQDVDDILDNEIVKESILNNADCKILLDMRKYLDKFDQIKHYLGITEHAASLILSLNRQNREGIKYKELAVILGNIAKVYGLEVSRHEYYLYTTEQKEYLQVYNEIEKCHGDIDLALQNIIDLENNLTTSI